MLCVIRHNVILLGVLMNQPALPSRSAFSPPPALVTKAIEEGKQISAVFTFIKVSGFYQYRKCLKYLGQVPFLCKLNRSLRREIT